MTPNTSTPTWRAGTNQLTTAIARAMNFNHRAVTATAHQPMAALPTAHTRPMLNPYHLTVDIGSALPQTPMDRAMANAGRLLPHEVDRLMGQAEPAA